MAIAKSSTGKFHRVSRSSMNADCNGRSFRGVRVGSEATLNSADEHMFCEKCFGLGRGTRKEAALANFRYEFAFA
jgi:hypothetical protein